MREPRTHQRPGAFHRQKLQVHRAVGNEVAERGTDQYGLAKAIDITKASVAEQAVV